MSEDPKNPGDEELEALLRGIRPAPIETTQLRSLARSLDRAVAERSVTSIHWKRLVVMAGFCFALSGAFLFNQIGTLRSTKAKQIVSSSNSQSASDTSVIAERIANTTAFPEPLPVTSHGTMINASNGGVIQTNEGLRQKIEVETQDAYHWHDAETGTEIHYTEPQREEFLIPLLTD